MRKFALAALAVLFWATFSVVLVPWLQLRRLPASRPETSDELIVRGRRQYVSLGCVYCHSQQPRDSAFSPADRAWGWGDPPGPAAYAGQNPHQLGTMRTGPDLWTIGRRQPSRDWHLLHLYQPRAVVPQSIMPAYPFLFARSGPGAPVRWQDTEVWPTPDGQALVAYLLSLKGETP